MIEGREGREQEERAPQAMARQEDNPVMLSRVLSAAHGAAKHLDAHGVRPFAALSMTHEGSSLSLHEAMGDNRSTMRADKLAECLRKRHRWWIGPGTKVR